MDATFLQLPQETTPGSTGISIRDDRRQPEKKTANLVTKAHHLATSTARDTDRRIVFSSKGGPKETGTDSRVARQTSSTASLPESRVWLFGPPQVI